MRARACTGCVLLALVACDQDYSFRLQARITARGASLEGAWIVPLSGSPTVDGVPLRTGPDGTAGGEYRAFNHVPSGDPLVVYHRVQLEKRPESPELWLGPFDFHP